jgi:hypothetical protein
MYRGSAGNAWGGSVRSRSKRTSPTAHRGNPRPSGEQQPDCRSAGYRAAGPSTSPHSSSTGKVKRESATFFSFSLFVGAKHQGSFDERRADRISGQASPVVPATRQGRLAGTLVQSRHLATHRLSISSPRPLQTIPQARAEPDRQSHPRQWRAASSQRLSRESPLGYIQALEELRQSVLPTREYLVWTQVYHCSRMGARLDGLEAWGTVEAFR